MARMPESYLKEKVDEAYALMLRKNRVRAGVARGLREAFDAGVDLDALGEMLDRMVTNDLEMSLRGKFTAALSRAERAWEPPRVEADVEFLGAAGGEWEVLGRARVDLGGYMRERMTLADVEEMAGDWDRFAEEVGYAMVDGGYVEAPDGCELPVCRRPEGLDEYVAEMRPAGR